MNYTLGRNWLPDNTRTKRSMLCAIENINIYIYINIITAGLNVFLIPRHILLNQPAKYFIKMNINNRIEKLFETSLFNAGRI
jgi:hypothetical protein